MGLGVTLQVWETDTDGDGVVSEMPHVGHKTFFFFFGFYFKRLLQCLLSEYTTTKMPSLTLWL